MRNKHCAIQMVNDKPVKRYLRKATDKKCLLYPVPEKNVMAH